MRDSGRDPGVGRARAAARLAAIALTVAACASSSAGVGGSARPRPTDAGSGSAAPPAGRIELTVFAAASLRDALGAAVAAYETASPGVAFALSFDASSALRAQVEQGAPVDVFASADTQNPEALVRAGLAGPPVPFAGNGLAIVVPAANPARIASPADLARPGVRIVNAGPEVPITAYAAALLANLARLPGYPPGYVAAVAANVVSREDNVRVVLAKVQLGEADAGIVYATDAASAGAAVTTIPIPVAAAVVATYAAVVPTAAPHPAAAAAFVDWLAGPAGRGILARFGFTAPPP